MKILLLTTSHPLKAAGIVAYDLLNALSDIEDNDVRILVKEWDRFECDKIIPIETSIEHYFNRIIHIINRGGRLLLKTILKRLKTRNDKLKEGVNINYYFERGISETFYSTEKILGRAGFKPDIVLTLFMPTFVSFKNLHEISKLTGAPIFLYQMDMGSMTGGCHYSWHCDGYTKNCGNCPALYSTNQNDQSRYNYLFKKKYIDSTDMYPIAGTFWQFMQLSKSSLFKNKDKFKVLLPVDAILYCPFDKIKARQELALPLNKKIIFFGSVSLVEERKGLRELLEALNILCKRVENPSSIHLAIAGNDCANLKDILPFSFTLLGYINHTKLPKVFQAADVFVSPSIEDSGPMMVNQSIISGTPVVSFDIGVALDLVHTGETGYRAKLYDSFDLAAGIEFILELDDKEYKKMSLKCRETGLMMCDLKKKGEEMMGIFKSQFH